jgi:hypothetical protein
VTVTGANLSLTLTPAYVNNVNAGTATASYTFDGDDNHTGSSDSKTFTIIKATPTVSVTGGNFTYDGQSHGATATAQGVGGTAVAGSFSFTYTPPGNSNVPVNPGTYSASASFTSSDPNYGNGASTKPATISITVSWSGVLQPINSDGNSVFKVGSTIPVKFRLTGASSGITNLIARIYLAKVTDNVSGTEMEAVSTSAADSGNTFRYDSTGDQYIFNLSTKSLSQGTWQIRIDFGDGTFNPVWISSRK